MGRVYEWEPFNEGKVCLYIYVCVHDMCIDSNNIHR